MWSVLYQMKIDDYYLPELLFFNILYILVIYCYEEYTCRHQ
jgi:hypothetical protein